MCTPQDGATCLFLAAQNGHARVVGLVLAAANANVASTGFVNWRRRDGATAVWMAAQMGYDSVIKILLRAGADPDISRSVV